MTPGRYTTNANMWKIFLMAVEVWALSSEVESDLDLHSEKRKTISAADKQHNAQ